MIKNLKYIKLILILVAGFGLNHVLAQSIGSTSSRGQNSSGGGFSFSSIVPPDPVNQKIYSEKKKFVTNDKLLSQDPLLKGIFGGGNNSNGGSGSENNADVLAAAGIIGGVATGGGSSSGDTTQVFFGGKLLTTITCTCTENFLLYIQDYRTQSEIQVIYQPGVSRLNQYYNFMTSGVSVLGSYLNLSMQCEIYSGYTCTTFGSPQGMISPSPYPGMGTSLI